MHMMSFDPANIKAAVYGKTASIFDVFPKFDMSDRLGVVVSSSIGMLGASMLIHTFGACYYKLRRDAGQLVAQYPEVYVVHLGGRYGDLRMLDVLPERKEIFVDTGAEALAAMNHAAVTRIAVPTPAQDLTDERPWHQFHPWETGPARERVRSTYLYSADGDVGAVGNIVLTGQARQIFDDFRCVYDIDHTITRHAQAEDDPEKWTMTLLARSAEVKEAEMEAARTRWESINKVGELRETCAMLPKATDFFHFL